MPSALSFLATVTCVRAVGCIAAGTAAVEAQKQNDPGLRTFVEQLAFPPASNQGIVLAARDGGVFAYGTAAFAGSMGGRSLNAPVVGIAETPAGDGYWEVASDGGVFNFGDAAFYGSMGGRHLNAPVVGIAATPDGRGYWLVAADGGIFNFGDAAFSGSMGGQHLNAPVVGMAASDGGGYWLVASDGGVFNYGSAGFFGSAGGLRLNAPVDGIAATPDGGGYWLVGSDGGVFNYGNAGFDGSVPGQGIVGQPPVVGIAARPPAAGTGWWDRAAPLRLRGRSVPRFAGRAPARCPVRAWRPGRRADGARRPSDEVGTAVHVDAGTGDVAVAPGHEVRGERGHLVGQAGSADVGGLVEGLVDPRHDVVGVRRVEVLGREDLLEVLGEAGGDDGAGAHGIDEDPIGRQRLGEVLGDARHRRL